MASSPAEIDFDLIETPTYLINETKLIQNLQRIKEVKDEAGIQVIAALKAFAHPWAMPLLEEFLDGFTASSLNEGLIVTSNANKPLHLYFPAYKKEELEKLLPVASHVSFNSLGQYGRFKEMLTDVQVEVGLRVNIGYAEIDTDLYNPSLPDCRLGIPIDHLTEIPEGVTGIHVHAMSENDSYTLERILQHLETHAGHLLEQISWINLGGGHLITSGTFDDDHFVSVLSRFKEIHGVELIIEPGAALVYEAGYLVAQVLDVVPHEPHDIAMLDVSFTAHMPDCLEMPYKPYVVGAIQPNELFSNYVMGGNTCLAGDQMGVYSFIKPLKPGDRVIFYDMIHYTMVKNNWFNGVQKPHVAVIDKDMQVNFISRMSHEDYLSSL